MKSIIYIPALVAIVLADIGSTYLRTPDLQRELNPIVRMLGSQWWVVWVTSLVVLVVCISAFFAFKRRDDLQGFPEGLNKQSFLGYEFYEGKRPWWHLWKTMPTRKGASLLIGSSLLAFGIPTAKLLASVSNYALTVSPGYEAILGYQPYLFTVLDATLALGVSLWIHFHFRFKAYQEQFL